MKYVINLACMLSLCFALGNTSINAADTKQEGQPELKVINLAVYPAPIPRPAMKYRLLPRLADQTPGNAALLYDTIFIRIAEEDGIRDGLSRDLKDEKEKEKYFTNADKLSLWLDTPLGELPKDEIRKILDNVQPWIMEYAEMASHRMECDWGLPIREINNPYEIYLPELHRARNLARILAMKARLSLAEEKPDDALKTLQIGFALSRQIGNGKETLINYLVGNAIARMMRDQLQDLIQLKDAPNLYWSLSNLPHPFLDFHNSVELEHFAMMRYFPAFQEARNGQHSPEQWQKLWEETIDKLNSLMEELSKLNIPELISVKNYEKVDAKAALEQFYPVARDYLIDLGRPEKEIRSMAPAHVMLLYGAEILDEMGDDLRKWVGINYSNWPDTLRESKNDLLKSYPKEVLPLASIFPDYRLTARNQALLERNFESLRCIEAIRLYAYSHGSKLPGSLDDIKEVPIPSNPMTGKPFSYHLEGDTAVLLADGDAQINYECRIKIVK